MADDAVNERCSTCSDEWRCLSPVALEEEPRVGGEGEIPLSGEGSKAASRGSAASGEPVHEPSPGTMTSGGLSGAWEAGEAASFAALAACPGEADLGILPAKG